MHKSDVLLPVYYARAMDRRTEAHICDDDSTVQDVLTKTGFCIANLYRIESAEPIDSLRLVERNQAILAESSLFLANLSIPQYPYAGLWFEMAAAYALRIPVAVWVGSSGYERHHYLRAHADFIGEDLESVVEYLRRACTNDGVAILLDEAKAYYDAIATRYGEFTSQTYPPHRDKQYDFERDRLATTLAEWCRGKRVLELGCGDGDWTVSIAGSARAVCCIDVNQSMLDQARARLQSTELVPEFVQCDFFDDTMSYQGYDVVVAFFVLGFMPRLAQQELLRRILERCDEGTIAIFAESVRQSEVPSLGLDSVRLQQRDVDGRSFVICKEVFSAGALAARVRWAGLEIVEELLPASWFSCCAGRVVSNRSALK